MDIEFIGKHLDKKSRELLGMKIDPMHRQGESDLVMRRWFDYHLLHPTQATYLYAHLYKEFTHKFAASYIDIRTSDSARSFTPEDIFMSRDLTCMSLARRCADGLGMPYEFALQFASDRALARTFETFPRPNQLYSEEFEIDLKLAWADSLSRSLRYSRLPYFQASQFVGDIMQKKHFAFVMQQIMLRPAASRTNLLARLLGENVLKPSMLEGHFSQEEMHTAETLAKRFT